MTEPDPSDEYDLPLDADLADINLMDIPALVTGAASASGSDSVSSQSKIAGSGTGTPVGERPRAIHSNLHRALFGADEGSSDARGPEISESETAGTPRSDHDGRMNHVVPVILGSRGYQIFRPNGRIFTCITGDAVSTAERPLVSVAMPSKSVLRR